MSPRPVLAPALVLFSIMLAHSILETARDALFLATLGPQLLAWAYLAIAAVAIVAITAVRRWGGVRQPRRVLFVFLAIAVAGTAALASAIHTTTQLVFALYVWTGFVATLVVPAFWTVVDRSLRVAEAKRVFGAIGAGGVLGAMTGSAIAGALGHVVGARHLVTVGAIAFAAALGTAIWLSPRVSVDEPQPLRRKAETISRRSRRYVRLLIVAGMVSTVTLTIGDFTFKRVISERFSADDLATVFGAIYTGLNFVALIIQLVITPRILSHWSVTSALLLLPALLLATASGFALTGAIVAIIALRVADGGLRHSLHRAGSEILFLPLPSSIRDDWKPVADAISQRGGQALAALLTFALASFSLGAQLLGVVVACLAVLWMASLAIVRRAYVAQFRDMLRAGEIERGKRTPDLDTDSVNLLEQALASPDELEALAALDLLANRARVPALVLYHPRETVVRHALSLLEGQLRPDIARVLGHLIEHSDPKIRAAALAAASRTRSNRPLLEAAIHDADPDVRATALVCLTDDAEYARASADGLAALLAGTEHERIALAHAIGFAPYPRFKPMLYQLLASHTPAIMREVLHVLARAPELAELDRLLELLEGSHVRGDVRRVFLAAGRRGLLRLIAALDDPRTPLLVRRHLPRTISRFRSAPAASALVARLLREPDGTTEFKILRALGRMRADDPSLPIDTDVLTAYAQRATSDAARYTVLSERLEAERAPLSAGGMLIQELLGEKRRWAIEHVFRALDILHPKQDLRSVHAAITGTDEARRSAAREILESLIPIQLREPLFAVLDDLTAEQRRLRLGDLAPAPMPSYESLLATLLADPSESLKCVVAHEVAERNLVSLRPDLARLRPLVGPPLVVYAFDQAIARLDA